MNPKPFEIAVDQGVLDRIAGRVRDAHRPALAAATGWRYGVDAAWFEGLVAYWRDGYDWRTEQQAMNRLPQFVAAVKARRLHFVHLRSPNPDARPLLLLHGWPYSFWSFSEVIAPLSRDFHVVVPSVPGFAFRGAGRRAARLAADLESHPHPDDRGARLPALPRPG